VFLPPLTTSLIQPKDQVFTVTFKAYNRRRVFAQAIAATEEDAEKTPMPFSINYSVYDCIKNLVWAWVDVTNECMNGIWKNTLTRFDHVYKGFAKDEKF
jgi:hypothetical protein